MLCAMPSAVLLDVGDSECAAGKIASEGSTLHFTCPEAALLSSERRPWLQCKQCKSAVSALMQPSGADGSAGAWRFTGRGSSPGDDPDVMMLSACSSRLLIFLPARVSARDGRITQLLLTVLALGVAVLHPAAFGRVCDVGPFITLRSGTAIAFLCCGLRKGRSADAVRHDARSCLPPRSYSRRTLYRLAEAP